VSSRPLEFSGEKIPATVSVGVAEFDGTMSGVSDLMKLADRMLYRAKRAGRNRIESAGDLRELPSLLSPALNPTSDR
jgi:diguanylate cyclase (GGDEF)-like protein